MSKEEFITCLDEAIDMLYREKNAISNSGYDETYCEIQITKKDGAIEALLALRFALTH